MRLRRQDLSSSSGCKESLILQIGKPALGEFLQVLLQREHDVGAPARLVIPIDVLHDLQVIVPEGHRFGDHAVEQKLTQSISSTILSEYYHCDGGRNAGIYDHPERTGHDPQGDS